MPMAMMLASRLRLNPRSWAMGRKKGPMPMRKPTVSRVSVAAAATRFHPKYHLPIRSSAKAISCLSHILPKRQAGVLLVFGLDAVQLHVVPACYHADFAVGRPLGFGSGPNLQVG